MRTNFSFPAGTDLARPKSPQRCQGFGLVEVMVVIAIVGVLAGIAMGVLSGVYTRSQATKAIRQAQNIAGTYAAAKAAGATFTVESKEGVVDALSSVSGVRGSGVYADCIFTVSMSQEEKDAVRISPVLVESTGEDGSFLLLYKP